MRIPTIKPGDTRLTTEVPTQPLDPKVASTGGRMLSDFGSGIAEVAGIFEKAQALVEHTKAQNTFETNLMNIEQRASDETDITPQKRQAYLDEINSSLGTAAKGISMPGNRDYFTAQMGERAKVGQAKLYSIFNDKVIDQAKADNANFMQLQKQIYIDARSNTEREMAILSRDIHLDKMADAGFLKKSEVAEEKIKLNKEWNDAYANTDISTNPQGALIELQKGERGFYAGMPSDERVKYIEKAQKRLDSIKKDGEQLALIAQNKKEDEFITASIKNQVTIDQVQSSLDAKEISPRFAKALISNLENPRIVPVRTDPAVYEEMMNMVMNHDNKASNIRATLLEKTAEKKLSEGDRRRLYYLRQQGNDMSVYQGYLAEKQPKNIFQKAWDLILSKLPGKDDSQDRVDVANWFIDDVEAAEIKDSNAIMEAAKKAVNKKIVERNPAIGGVRKEGQIMIDVNGNKALVFPDGSHEEIQ